MLTLCHFDYDHPTTVPSLHPPLLELQVEIPLMVESTTMNRILHRHLDEVTTCKSTAILILECPKKKYFLITNNECEMLMESKHPSTR